MRNAKNSALNRYAVKNGCNRDGNEKIRKGLGGTNRSVRMDWFPDWPCKTNAANPERTPTASKIARQEPVFAFHEDGVVDGVDTWEWYSFFDKRQQKKEPRYYVYDGVCHPIGVPVGTDDDGLYRDGVWSMGYIEDSTYSVQQDAYGDWSTAIGRLSLDDAKREAHNLHVLSWYAVRVVRDYDGAVIAHYNTNESVAV